LWYYDGEMNLNPEEVNDYKWIWIEELKKDIIENPEIYTQWFKIILEKYFQLR
jgi:isopentenyl-diphosphate delta-isomerase